jgi:hypothetical protein
LPLQHKASCIAAPMSNLVITFFLSFFINATALVNKGTVFSTLEKLLKPVIMSLLLCSWIFAQIDYKLRNHCISCCVWEKLTTFMNEQLTFVVSLYECCSCWHSRKTKSINKSMVVIQLFTSFRFFWSYAADCLIGNPQNLRSLCCETRYIVT